MATTSTTTSQSPASIDTEPAYLPFRPEVFENSTWKQRLILLVARDAVLRGNATNTEIASIAGVSQQYVPVALTKFVHRKDLPTAYCIANRCISKKNYDENDLTDAQRRIVNETVVNPELSQSDIAAIVSRSASYVHYVQRMYNDIIQSKNPRAAVLNTPIEANDIPLDDFLKDRRDSLPVLPNDLPYELVQPFSEELLNGLDVTDRYILLAAREWAVRSDVTISGVMKTVDVQRDRVKRTIASFRHREDEYPTAASVAAEFFPDLSHETLTGKKREIVNEFIINPDQSLQTVAKHVDVSASYVWHVREMHSGIIEQQREHIGATGQNSVAV